MHFSNKTKNLFNYLILTIVLGNFSYGQYQISGTVTDSLQTPLNKVNVYLKTKKDSIITGFTFTDNKGNYTIKTEVPDLYILTFNALSYQAKSFTVNLKTNQRILKKNVKLKKEALTLDEVVLKYERKITIKKDTIILKASAFADGREEVVEDLLQKLPGIEVNSNGTISVEGQNIEKVMVEGDDLFEKRYQLLTKNLNAEVIDKIEILKKYSNNSILKGIEDSDKVALNLTLKEGRKSQLFGNASTGYGSDNNYEVKVNLISFLKKMKFYSFANFNNIGNDPTGDIGTLINPNAYGTNYFVGDDENISGFTNINTSIPNLGFSNTNFNNAEFLSLNSIYNPSKKLKIKTIGFLTFDEKDFFRSSFTRFTLPDETKFTNTEEYTLRKKYDVGYLKLDTKYEINKTSNINYIGKYNYTNTDTFSNSLFNKENIDETANINGKYHDHKLDYTIKTNKNKALIIQSRYLNHNLPENYNVNTFLYQSLFPDQENIASVRQLNTNKLNFFGVTANYIINTKRKNLNIKIGYTQKKNSLISNLVLISNQENIISSIDGYQNDVTFYNKDFFTEASYKIKFKNLSLTGNISTHQLFTTFQDHILQSKKKKNPFYIAPNIQLQYGLDKKNKIISIYSHNTDISNFNILIDNNILSNYRNFYSGGIKEFTTLNSDFFLFNYIYGNWSDEFLINASFVHNESKDFFSSDTTINQDFNQSNQIILPNKSFTNISLTLDKYLKKLSSNLKLKSGYIITNFKNIINNSEVRNIENTSINYGIEFRSAFSNKFNFHIGTSWNTSIVKTNFKNDNTDNTTFLDITYNATNKFSFQLKNERYHFGSLEEGNNTFYFSDFDIKYIVKPNTLSFKLIGHNLFNTNTFGNFSISDTAISSTTYNLIPRYLFLKMDFRF